jgi:hypothetical protein
MNSEQRTPNSLIHENSPYLLQHAHNPVRWLPWSKETLAKAQAEDKPLLISIGYAACHWCHVMAHETFEDEAAASVMNAHFICIKVDREERPDIDQIYMEATQMMTGGGGWPLNCFALPDGSPFYGGTYYPRGSWIALCENVAREFHANRLKVEQYARELKDHLAAPYPFLESPSDLRKDGRRLADMVDQWKISFDRSNGGENHAPKFPMPVNLEFLLAYGRLNKDDEVIRHVLLTLRRMAMGGIYDQIGGGFTRYSTDMIWKVPHFEKMLYDNAQLVSLYTRAWQVEPDPLFNQVVEETIAFVQRELMSPEDTFYSSLDADSESVEGKYYTWELPELEITLGDLLPAAREYYAINANGFWEDGRYILLRQGSVESVAARLDMPAAELEHEVKKINQLLLKARDQRKKPALDDKSLASWNGLMIKALAEAGTVFGRQDYLRMAEQAANFILANFMDSEGGLFHTYRNGQASIPGFLEDYASVADACFALYQSTFDERWLRHSEALVSICLKRFFIHKLGVFSFSTREANTLGISKTEIMDGVIPSSNSVIAHLLFKLSRLLDHSDWEGIALGMLARMEEQIYGNGSMFAHWARLMLFQVNPFFEIAVTGKDAGITAHQLQMRYLPNTIFAASHEPSALPILQDRFKTSETMVFVCENKACRLPVSTVEAALSLIEDLD